MQKSLTVLAAVPLFGFLVACGTTRDSSKTDVQALSSDAGDPSGLDPSCAAQVNNSALAAVNLIVRYDKSGTMGDYSRLYECGVRDITCRTVSRLGSTYYVCATTNDAGRLDAACSVSNGVVSCTNTNTGLPCSTETLGNGKVAQVCSNIGACTLSVDADPARKWTPAANGLKSFITDASSAGTSATLAFFPTNDASTGALSCSADAYKSSTGPEALGPSATTLASQIDGVTAAGTVPTRPALEGALAEARFYQSTHAGERTAVVLVTDSLPSSCDATEFDSTDDVDNVAVIARSYSRDATTPIETHVIALQDTGLSLAPLNQIAAAGSADGAGLAHFVSVGEAGQTSSGIALALASVRDRVASCEIDVSASDAGTFDPHTVNVVASFGGIIDTLSYSPDCATGNGWNYTDGTSTRIHLCSTSCSEVRSQASSQMFVSFGCATKGYAPPAEAQADGGTLPGAEDTEAAPQDSDAGAPATNDDDAGTP